MKYVAKENILLLDCLQSLYPDSPKTRLRKLMAQGKVWVGVKLVKIPRMALVPGMVVEIRKERFVPSELPNVKILFEDEHFLVVEKKEQFLSVATDKEKVKTAFHQIFEYLLQKYSKAHLFVVHRLDYGTSGLLLFAKTKEAQEKLRGLFADRQIARYYRAVVQGHPEPPEAQLENRLAESQTLRVYVARKPGQGKHAITQYKVIKKGLTCSLLDVRILTGRRGQIRVQLATIGHPVVGDHEYGDSFNPLDRLCLHACRLEFNHPMTGKAVVFESKMPPSFLNILNVKVEGAAYRGKLGRGVLQNSEESPHRKKTYQRKDKTKRH